MSRFKATYDERGDVLYTYLDFPRPAICIDDGEGLLLRTSISENKPCGVTVLDLKSTYGQMGGDALCFNIQHFLKIVTLQEVEDVIYPILGYRRQ